MRRLKVESDQGIRMFPLPREGELSLGSSRDNDIVLAVTGVSRYHARLDVTGGAPRLVDLGSKNLLIVDGERRREVLLQPGNAVQIGSALLWIEEVSTADGEVGLRIDGSSSLAPLTGTRETDGVASEPGVRTPAAALRLVRRYQGAVLAGETRRRFLDAALAVLGGRTLLRYYAAPDDGEGLVIEDAAGPLPPAELRAALAGLAPVEEPRLSALGDGTPCLWCGRLPPAAGAAADSATILAVLADRDDPPIRPPAAWRSDFVAYLAERLSDEEPSREPATARPARAAGELDPPPGMILGSSPAVADLLEQIRASSASRQDVLLQGETGTGKELVARLIHRSGPTADGSFVAINCAAIPGDLLEAELFGVARRVATGVDPRPGLFQLAQGGTLLLDEIADLHLPLQAKLLRVLQEREILPLGAPRVKKIDVRVISTTNCDLKQRVADGAFRADLYYRLDGLRFVVPPLRERTEDIPSLTRAFARLAAAEAGRRVRGLSVRALEILAAYDWPGNVRELRTAVERAVLACRSGVLESGHFQELTPSRPSPAPPPAPREDPPAESAPVPLKQRLDAEERRAILETLTATRGNRSEAARRLGISRQGLIMKLRRLEIDQGPRSD